MQLKMQTPTEVGGYGDSPSGANMGAAWMLLSAGTCCEHLMLARGDGMAGLFACDSHCLVQPFRIPLRLEACVCVLLCRADRAG